MTVSALLASLQKQAKVKVAETRTLEDGTQVKILVGNLPLFPHGNRPTWYPLVLLPGQSDVSMKEVEAILRRFWNYQLKFAPGKIVKHSKATLKRK